MERDKIEAIFTAIRAPLDEVIDPSDVAAAENNLTALKSVSGNSAEICRICEEILLTEQNKIMDEVVEKKMSPNVLAMYMKAKFPYEVSCLSYAQRLDEKVGSAISALQSILKLRTSEMRNSC